MCFGTGLWVYPLECAQLLEFYRFVFSQMGEVFSHYKKKHFCSPPALSSFVSGEFSVSFLTIQCPCHLWSSSPLGPWGFRQQLRTTCWSRTSLWDFFDSSAPCWEVMSKILSLSFQNTQK